MGNLRSYNFRGQGVWIGLTRPRDGASFTWVTGEPMDFQYWAPGQPGSGSGGRRRRLLLDGIHLPTGFPSLHLPSLHLPKLFHEDCVLLKYTDSGRWHDYPCEQLDLVGLVPENYPYVCEYPHMNGKIPILSLIQD
ncbi:hypothetical protein FSP39_009730 [Pinctada imbricata]|uniref:C-type lectin domain-containing protein n=1 Tax=Pinctada imbricata TaxID=66713 RepID=A0AA89C3S7_PINIB|nr:hypothetical protein FSP39_009730 [Pinctada imbricata]